jgi:hypothetical protein
MAKRETGFVLKELFRQLATFSLAKMIPDFQKESAVRSNLGRLTATFG